MSYFDDRKYHVPAFEHVGKPALVFKHGQLLATLHVGAMGNGCVTLYINRGETATYEILKGDPVVKFWGDDWNYAGFHFDAHTGQPAPRYDDPQDPPSRYDGLLAVDKEAFHYGFVDPALFGNLPGYWAAFTNNKPITAADEQLWANLVDCPWSDCLAPAGTPCKHSEVFSQYPHTARTEAAQALIKTPPVLVLTREEQRRKAERARRCRWAPQHFPTGTLFEVNETVVDKDYSTTPPTLGQSIFIVRGIVRNGAQSWVLKTGVMQKSTGERAFNLAHVKRIVTLGTGPVEVDQGGWYGRPDADKFTSEVKMMELRGPIEGHVFRRGYYHTGSLRTLVLYEFAKSGAGSDAMLDVNALFDAVAKQSWVKLQNVNEFIPYWTVNKKRLRSFVRRNYTRYLQNLKATTEAYDKEMERLYCEDWDDGNLDDIMDARDEDPIEAQESAAYRRRNTHQLDIYGPDTYRASENDERESEGPPVVKRVRRATPQEENK